jgi:two-component system, LytTR family, response regulator
VTNRVERRRAIIDSVHSMLTALLVDDEPLARKRMRALLGDHPDVTVIGEAGDGEEALQAIASLQPAVVFLDVQMPGADGFEVVRRLDEASRPLIVFVTAFEQYALDAFRASAVQYLLKPVERDELGKALLRVRQLVQLVPPAQPDLTELVERLQPWRAFLQRVAVKSKGRMLLFRIEEVDWLESAGNYVRLHIGGECYLLRETMSGIEERLDPQQFLRVHRTAIINLDRLRELQPTSHGEYLVILHDDTRLTLSRVYRDRVEPLLGKL